MFSMIYYSDLQIHDWQHQRDPDFWKLGLKCIDAVYEVAKRNAVDLVLFGGDLFQSKRTLRSDIAVSTFRHISKMVRKHKDMQHWFVAGNHDWYNGSCTLNAIQKRSNVQVFTEPYRVGESDEWPAFNIIPYGHWDESQLPTADGSEVSVFHSPFEGAKISKNVFDAHKTPAGYDDIVEHSALSLCGHYHDEQAIGDVQCVGAPMYFNWSDVDAPKGRGCFLVRLDEERRHIITKHEFTWAPRFVSTPDLATKPEDIVRYPLGKTQKNANEGKLREGASLVSSDDMNQALKAYIEYAAPDYIPQSEYEEVLALGRGMFACTE